MNNIDNFRQAMMAAGMSARPNLDPVARAVDALHFISPDIGREEWVKTCMAAKDAGISFEAFDDWSAGGSTYNPHACRSTWNSAKPGKGVGEATLFYLAKVHGWKDSASYTPAPRPIQAPVSTPAPAPTYRPGMAPAEVWARCEAATIQHPYIVEKQAAGVLLHSLRVLPAGDALPIHGEPMAGALVVPVIRPDNSLASLQFIALPDVAARLKAKGKTAKLNLPGAPLEDGFFTVGEFTPGCVVYLCEGIGTAWSCWQINGDVAVVCFGWSRVRKVAHLLRERDPSARLVLVPDVGKEADADKIAQEVNAAVVRMPDGWPKNSDVNDLAKRDGGDALAELLDKARDAAPSAPEPHSEYEAYSECPNFEFEDVEGLVKQVPVVAPGAYPLSVAFADSLPDEFVAPDELVEGVLTAGDGSVLYGDSNSGKTFFVIDMACAVARGVPWMGRNTEKGMVVYIAAESPASVRGRLQAYQKHHGVKVPNFAIVQNPIDLFDGDGDTNRIIELVKMLEAQTGDKVRLIVGDTLARMSAGANENAGQDMGLVVRRFDRIRTECKAHFLLIHHSGKNAAAGSRGWSGVRAAVDTEIEVTDAAAGRCCEVTKQRDLATKGQRIGFKLEVVTLGLTKWGAPATSCVVIPEAAPEKAKGKRMSECDGAVLEFLVAHKTGIRKADVVKHFAERYEKSPIYRAIKSLVAAGAINEAAGMVCVATAAK